MFCNDVRHSLWSAVTCPAALTKLRLKQSSSPS